MRTRPRLLFITLLLVAGSLSFYAWRAYAQQTDQRRALEAKIENARSMLKRAEHERDAAEHELTRLARAAKEAEEAAAAVAAEAAALPSSAAVTTWEYKTATLRSFLGKNREWVIPEIDLLSPDEFIFFARDAQLDSEDDRRKAVRDLRALAKRKLARIFHDALDEYALAHGGQLPTDLGELAKLFETPVPEAILRRYALTGVGAVSEGKDEILLYERAPVDELYDTRHVLGARMSVQFPTNADVYLFTRAVLAYSDANAGRKPTEPSQLAAYLEVPLDPAVLSRYFNGWQKSPATLDDPAMPTMRRTSSVMMFRPIGAPRVPAK